ncbi:hypothetical protein JCM17845_26110 [Iodidimonas gelatinilytica]|uniref:Organic solvent tolerance-like N-terminal domain-containing protein n=1 Tax=Iodidimonas gelatinilytica TaxID=1236966 RepID=A0A5A7N1J9_9PROT|nr:LptA/OstA family protein [Iodidimonas gelatinilytica]GER01988.1 hypothetical protein JCM17845_26110 [Iodidimonas gelatinilytica]
MMTAVFYKKGPLGWGAAFKRLPGLRGLAVLSAMLVGQTALAQSISALKDHDIDQAIEWEAQRSELLGRDDVALFMGNVRVKQGALELHSDRLHVFYTIAQGQTDPNVERLDVTGNVEIVSPSERALSQWAVYDIPKRIITLGGGVVLTRGDTRLAGDRLEIDLVSGVTKLDGEDMDGEGARVRGRFVLPERSPENGTPKTNDTPQ